MSAIWRQVNLVCSVHGDRVQLKHQPLDPMRGDLLALFERSELSKYLTSEELPAEAAGTDVPGTEPEASPATPKETH